MGTVRGLFTGRVRTDRGWGKTPSSSVVFGRGPTILRPFALVGVASRRHRGRPGCGRGPQRGGVSPQFLVGSSPLPAGKPRETYQGGPKSEDVLPDDTCVKCLFLWLRLSSVLRPVLVYHHFPPVSSHHWDSGVWSWGGLVFHISRRGRLSCLRWSRFRTETLYHRRTGTPSGKRRDSRITLTVGQRRVSFNTLNLFHYNRFTGPIPMPLVHSQRGSPTPRFPEPVS